MLRYDNKVSPSSLLPTRAKKEEVSNENYVITSILFSVVFKEGFSIIKNKIKSAVGKNRKEMRGGRNVFSHQAKRSLNSK